MSSRLAWEGDFPSLTQTRNAHSSPCLEGQGTPGRFVYLSPGISYPSL